MERTQLIFLGITLVLAIMVSAGISTLIISSSLSSIKKEIISLNSSINNKTLELNKSISGQLNSINNSVQLESAAHFEDIQNTMKSSMVFVYSYPPENTNGTSGLLYVNSTIGNVSYGTGFSIDSRGDILTAYHVVKNADVVIIAIPNTNIQIKVPTNDIIPLSNFDLAILRVNTNVTPVKIQQNFSSAKTGEAIAFAGYPLVLHTSTGILPVLTMVTGSIAGLDSNFEYANNTQPAPVYFLGGAINPGNSGGPVFSLEDGTVIGIINDRFTGSIQDMGISTAISSQLINVMLNYTPN